MPDVDKTTTHTTFRGEDEYGGAAMRYFLAGAFVVAVVLGSFGVTFPATPDYATMRQSTVVVSLGQGHGSGVLVGPRLILTAAHVVANEGDITVEFEGGETMTATRSWSGAPATFDVAMIVLPKDAPVAPARMDCAALAMGDALTAIGAPLSGRWVSANVTVASERKWGPNPSSVTVQGPFLPGMSGGPVFNANGDVAGIVSAFLVLPMPGAFGASPTHSGMSALAPSSEICSVLPGVDQ